MLENKDFFKLNNAETHHDARYFAMLHNAAAIADNKALEGGEDREALAYYNYLLNLEIPNCPISFQLSSEQLTAVKTQITNLISINAFIESNDLIHSNISQNSLINEIKDRCQKQGSCYLPSGYKGELSGHFAALKIRPTKEGKYALSVLNHGDGIRYHRKLSTSGHKDKFSYQSDEYEIDLTSDNGRELLQKILELNAKPFAAKDTQNVLNPYSADDLYGLLKLYAKEISLEDKITEKSVTPQRTGTCTVTNIHAIARDILVDHNADHKTRKHYHFVIKLRSLIDGFNAYCEGRNSYASLEWALKEFSVRVNKYKSNILSDEEVIYCGQLQTQIQQRLTQDKEVDLQEKCKPQPLPPLTGDAPPHTAAIIDLSRTREPEKPKTFSDDIEAPTTNKIKPEDIVKLIKFEPHDQHGNKQSFDLQKMYQLFNSLPPCTGLAKDTFWDKVPKDHIDNIIGYLSRITEHLTSSPQDSPLSRSRTFALSLMIYDIAAQLAPRYPVYKGSSFQGFKLTDKFAFGLDDIYSEQFFFTDPTAYYTLKRISENFAQRGKNKQRIFSNAVNYDHNNYDHTIHYIIRVLLDDNQRKAIAQARMQKEGKESAQYSDEELFDHLMKDLKLTYHAPPAFLTCYVLDHTIQQVLKIAATAHALGNYTETYKKKENKNLWLFNENHFHRELDRQEELEKTEIAKHFPGINRNTGPNTFQDFSENTIYHPDDNLKKLQNDFKDRSSHTSLYSPKAALQPYQLYLSGSLRPDSSIWTVDDTQQSFYEELNEELRHIECSTHLQVVRVLAWSKNNVDKLKLPEIRTRIQELLFQYGKLDSALANHLQATLHNMGAFLTALYKYCSEEAAHNIELAYWSANLAYDLRHYTEVTAKLYNLPVKQFSLPNFRELLLIHIQNSQDTAINSKLANQVVKEFRNSSPLSLENCCLILITRMLANLDDANPSNEIWNSLSKEILTTFTKEKGNFSETLNSLLATYFKFDTNHDWQLIDSRLQSNNTDFYIDLATGSLQKPGIKKPKDRTSKTLSENKELFDRLNLSTDNITLLCPGEDQSYEIILTSSDGKWVFTCEKDRQSDGSYGLKVKHVFQHLTIEKNPARFKLLSNEEINTLFHNNNPFESNSYCNTNYLYWQSVDQQDLFFVQQAKQPDTAYYGFTDNEVVLISGYTLQLFAQKSHDPNFVLNDALEQIRDISDRTNNAPVLIEHKLEYYLYGFADNTWKITKLIDYKPNDDLYKIFKQLKCNPDSGQWSKINRSSLAKEIQEVITSKQAHASPKDQGLRQLIRDDSNHWQRNDQILLNLIEPKTELERQWANRLAPMFGVKNLRCVATLNESKTSCTVTRIEHLMLDLNFVVNDQQQLVCNEVPGYFLSHDISLSTINGLPSLIVLQNDKVNKKYILPAFALNKGENNNALNYENIIDYDTLCHKSPPHYYTYTLNAGNELVGDSIEANLYLAILYRSQGNFKQALKSLERCKSYKNINATAAAIAMQAIARKMKSPMGAAFDLKLEYYLKMHQGKWSKDNEQRFEPVKFPNDWSKWLTEQLKFYNNTFSHYKDGIAILPNYCRLTEDELKFYGQPTHSATTATAIEPTKRIKSVSHLPDQIINGDAISWRRHIEANYDLKTFPSHEFANHRFYHSGDKNPAYSYLRAYFSTLFEKAISTDEEKRANKLDKLYKELFSLLQNDKEHKPETYELIALLLFASRYPAFFKDFKIPSSTVEAILQVGIIFQQHKEELKDDTVNLLEYHAIIHSSVIEKPLSSNLSPDPTQFTIDAIKLEQECKKTLSHLVDFYFSRTDSVVAESDFKLDLSGLPNASLLENRLFEHYRKGHLENQTKKKTVYKVTEGWQLKDLKQALTSHKEDDEGLLAKLAENLINKANKTPLDYADVTTADQAKAVNLLIARHSEQKQAVTISDLLTALLQRDPTLLTTQNPFLSQTGVNDLFTELANYALLSSRIAQTNEALNIIGDKKQLSDIEAYELQLIASTLDKSRAYNIKDYPEFLMYEYESQRLLRKDQVDILKKLIHLIENDPDNNTEMHHGLLQFAAGGGKTSVLIPILAQRFASKGLLPIIINTNELYDIGVEEIPKNLRFKQSIEVIERDLDHVWTEKELEKLLQDLEQWRKEKKCLLIKATTWHSINITMKWAHSKWQPKLAQAAQAVLDFFKTKSVKLEDECHIVSNPLLQSIKTLGDMHKIPDEQLDLLLHCYDYLMGDNVHPKGVTKLERSITPEELTELQKKLATIITQEEIFKDIPQEQLFIYLLQPEKNRPDWLRELSYSWNKTEADAKRDDQIANLVVLARAFIKTHLPHILSLQYRKDYGESINEGDLTAAPKHESKDVTAHFGDHTLVVALSIQLYSQRGLLPIHVKQLLDLLIKEHKQEREWNHNLNVPTQAEHWLMQHVPENYTFSSYCDLTDDLKSRLSKDEKFFKNPDVIEKFLTRFVLPQIKVPTERITSTAAELQAGFNRSLLFSATPGLAEAYPAFLKPENCFLEAAFEAQVIDTLLESKNSKIYTLKKSQNPTEFFEQFPADFLNKMTTLIDRGALLTDFDAKEIISAYLNLDPKKHHVATQRASFFFKKNGKEYMHLRSNDPNVKEDNNILGSSLIEALKKQGIKPEKFLLFLFLDLSKTTGTDIKRPHDDKAGLTIGKEQTVTETIQAAMRERQLLADDAQSISWLMFQSLYKEINPNDKENFDPRQIFYWLIKNEANEIKDKIMQRAYQGIDQAIKAIAWQETNRDPKSFNAMHGFSYELRERQDSKPWNIYEQDSIEKDTKWVLRDYKNQLLEKFQFEKRNIIVPKETLDHIEKIIIETSNLIAKLQTPPKTQLGTQVQQEMQTQANVEEEQKQEQRIKTKLDTASDFVFELEQYTADKDNLSNIFAGPINNTRYQTIRLPACDNIKQPELLFCPKHFAVTQQVQESNHQELEQLKPIKMLLVKIMPDHAMRFLACTAAGAEYYSSLINGRLFTKNDPSYALITADGDILHVSNNLDLTQCQQAIQSEPCQKILTYAHFLNGKINNPITLSQIVKEHDWNKESYENLANAIATIHVGRSPVSLLKNEALDKLCGWNGKTTQEPKTHIKRYHPPADNPNKTMSQQNLQPVSSLDNGMETSSFPISGLQPALEHYVFGDKPQPIIELAEDSQLNLAIRNIKSTHNSNNIKEKDLAISKLHDAATKVINSFQEKAEKIKLLQNIHNEFKELDVLLENLYKRLQKLSDSEIYSKKLALNAINYTYKNYSQGEQPNECLSELKELLENISQESNRLYKEQNKNRSQPAQLFFKLVPNCELTTILNDTIKDLEISLIKNPTKTASLAH